MGIYKLQTMQNKLLNLLLHLDRQALIDKQHKHLNILKK